MILCAHGLIYGCPIFRVSADHSFQIANTLNQGASAYQALLGERNYITYWRAIDVDASGRLSAEVYGNGVVNDFAYNQGTGQLQSIHSGLLSYNTLRHTEYQYDEYNNVLLRDDLVNDITETFEYDRLDRLTSAQVQSGTYTVSDLNKTQSMRYNALGNITYKSDVGNYTYYGSTNKVHKAGNKTYTYDANGNLQTGDGRTALWSTYNKPTRIAKGSKSATFSYDADNARYKKVNHLNDITFYVGGIYEKRTYKKANRNHTEQKHTILVAGSPIAEHIVSTENGIQTRYLHKDALGSVDLITDGYANVVDRRSFDAWGKLRNWDWKTNQGLNDPLYQTQLPFTNKGYTGHESIQEVDLIHMNGRVYDATLGRFLSADPNIQSETSSQSYNRYSYVWNNPMKYTDPSGYFLKKLSNELSRAWQRIRPFVSTIVAVALTASGVFTGIGGAMLIGALSGAAGAAANGGNLKDVFKAAVIGTISGAAFSSIGVGLEKGLLTSTEGVLLHGLTGGAMSVIQGGKFGHGFMSAGVAKFASLKLQAEGTLNSVSTAVGNKTPALIARTAISAAIGGVSAKLGGGKFANGAATAAFAHLVNSEGGGGKGDPLTEAEKNALKADLDKINAKIKTLPEFASHEEVFAWVEENIYPISVKHQTEVGVNVFRDIKFRMGSVVTSYSRNEVLPKDLFGSISTKNLELSIHTHPGSNSLGFSPDKDLILISAYLNTKRFSNVTFAVTFRNEKGVQTDTRNKASLQ